MSHHCSLSTCALLFLLTVIPSVEAFSKESPAKPTPSSGNGYTSMTAEDNVKTSKNMPNPRNRETRAALHCNLCVAAAHELYDGLTSLRRLRHNAPKYVEYVDELDKVCKLMVKDYGLAVDQETKRPLLIFRSKKDTPQQVSGHWVTDMIAERCGDLIEEHESSIIKLIEVAKDETAFTNKLCIDVTRTCERGEVSEGEL